MRRALAVAALVVTPAACYELDFTEPIVRTTALFTVYLEQGAGVAGVPLQATLSPPSEDGVVTPVPDPVLRIDGRPVALSSDEFVWVLRDTLELDAPAVVTFALPSVPGVGPAPELHLPLGAPTERLVADGWAPGHALALALPDPPAGGDVPVETSWTLTVDAWRPDGSGQVFFLFSGTDPGRRVEVNGSLLPSVAPDSLEAVLQLRRVYGAGDADSTYTARASVATTLRWRVPVLPPT